jgi:hypothetical protein
MRLEVYFHIPFQSNNPPLSARAGHTHTPPHPTPPGGVSDTPEIRTHCFSVSSKRMKNVVKSSPEADLRQKDKRDKKRSRQKEDKVAGSGGKPPQTIFSRDAGARPDITREILVLVNPLNNINECDLVS